jgi:hypothetical protein
MIGHSNNLDEGKRVRTADGLKIEKLFDLWSVRLRVANPLYGHNYGITLSAASISQICNQKIIENAQDIRSLRLTGHSAALF